MPYRLLAVFAHPDDESFGPGGTLAKYAAEGVRVAVVIATRGEGSALGADLYGSDLGRVRTAELECASKVLGISELTLWSYPDTKLDQVDIQELAGKVASVISEFRPDVMMTFDPSGITGNPDHIAMTRAVVRAYSNLDTSADGGHRPALYTWSITSRMAEHLETVSSGTVMGINEEEVSAIIDTSSYIAQQWEAIHCHKSQSDPLPPVMKELMTFDYGKQYFVRHGQGSDRGRPAESLFS